MRHLFRTFLIATLPFTATLLPTAALAQSSAPGNETAPITSSVEFGDNTRTYELFYSLVPSTFLTDSVANAYGITRANNRMLVNVSVREQLADGNTREQPAQVKGSYSDLIQKKTLEFREVREQGAIYYIAEFRHGNRETLRFDIAVTTPDGVSKSVTFTRTLYVDE